MRVIWQSVKFDEANVVAVYARGYSDGTIKFFDVDKKSKTIREYFEHRNDVALAIAVKVPTDSFDKVRIR